jgi:hypothetical protein
VKELASKETSAAPFATREPAQADSRSTASARWSETERKAIREELQRLLASSLFHSSHRCQILLRYVVEEALNGNADMLKERTIGVSVFQRDLAYDTNSDPVVRMAAGELRKKLAQYYYDSANQSHIWIELPIGSYAPVFRMAEKPSPKIQAAFPETETRPSEAALEPAPLALTETPQIEIASASLQAHRRRKVYLWAAAALIPVAAALAHANFNYFRSAQSHVWSPILDSGEPVTICLGDFDELGNSDDLSLEQKIIKIIDQGKLPQRPATEPRPPEIPFVDVGVAIQIAGYLSAHNQAFTVRRESKVTLDDLRRGPAVLVGAFDNAWTLVVLSNLRYRVKIDPINHYVWVQDTQNPDQRDWRGSGNQNYADSSVDYAIVTRVLDPDTGKWILLAAGLGMHGTEAAGELLTDPALANAWPSGLTASKKNFQVVIKTTVMDGHTGIPQIVSVYTW